MCSSFSGRKNRQMLRHFQKNRNICCLFLQKILFLQSLGELATIGAALINGGLVGHPLDA